MDTIFFTDGRGAFVGPVLKDEMKAIIRAKRQLKENHGAEDVFAIQAGTLEEARSAWLRASKKDKA